MTSCSTVMEETPEKNIQVKHNALWHVSMEYFYWLSYAENDSQKKTNNRNIQSFFIGRQLVDNWQTKYSLSS